jgi:ribosomal protein S18 acetylase RimI-like enzyme
MTVRVRPAHLDELGEVGDVTVAAYDVDGFLLADDPYVPRLRDAAARAREAEVYVATLDDLPGRVAGTVTFCAEGSAWREIAQPGEGEFRMLGVAASARRRGIAEALVVRCIERSGELGYRSIVMSSMPQMAAAHRLYERLGFVRLPDRDWSPVEGLTLLAFTRPVS